MTNLTIVTVMKMIEQALNLMKDFILTDMKGFQVEGEKTFLMMIIMGIGTEVYRQTLTMTQNKYQ